MDKKAHNDPMTNTTTHPITKATLDEAGCWIDGHWGQYGIAQMIVMAADRGYVDPATTPPFAQNDIVGIARRHLASMGPSTSPDIEDHEYVELDWTCDDVEAWMNDNLAPDGFVFEWVDGEFFLSTTDDESDGE